MRRRHYLVELDKFSPWLTLSIADSGGPCRLFCFRCKIISSEKLCWRSTKSTGRSAFLANSGRSVSHGVRCLGNNGTNMRESEVMLCRTCVYRWNNFLVSTLQFSPARLPRVTTELLSQLDIALCVGWRAGTSSGHSQPFVGWWDSATIWRQFNTASPSHPSHEL